MLKRHTISKEYLAKSLAKEVDIKNSDAYACIAKLFDIVIRNLREGNDIDIADFGSFNIKQKIKRLGINPKTGDIAEIAPRKVVKFQTSSKLKQKVNNLDNNNKV